MARAAAVRVVPGAVDVAALAAELDALAGSVQREYLHVDLDALDTSVGRANAYAAAGGPGLDALEAVCDRFAAAAAALTAYDPGSTRTERSPGPRGGSPRASPRARLDSGLSAL